MHRINNLLLLLMLGCFPDVAWSDESVSTQLSSFESCIGDKECESLSERARDNVIGGNLPEALKLYHLAYQLRADPRLLYSIGRILHKQGRVSLAVPYYSKFIESPVDDPEQKSKARSYVEEIGLATDANRITTTPLAIPDPTPVRPEALAIHPKPVYRKWWFWTLIGTSVVGATIGIALGVYSVPPQYPFSTTVDPFRSL